MAGRPAGADRVDKQQLSKALGWSRDRLTRRLNDDTDFPVLRRGDKTTSWAFSLRAVRAYLGDNAALSRQAETADAAKAAGRLDVPSSPTQGRRSATAFNPARDDGASGDRAVTLRLKEAQTAKVEDSVRQARQGLLEAAPMRVLLSQLMGLLAQFLDDLPARLAQRVPLSDDLTAEIKGKLRDELDRFGQRVDRALAEGADIAASVPDEPELNPPPVPL